MHLNVVNKIFVFDASVYCFVVTVIYCDNQKAQTLIKNLTFHARNKHIDIQHHFVRNKVQNDTLELRHIVNNNQIVDNLIKFLLKNKFLKFRRNIDFH